MTLGLTEDLFHAGASTLAATDHQLGGAAPGIGFAIPCSVVTTIGGQMIKTGHVTNSHRAALGVRVQTVTGARWPARGRGHRHGDARRAAKAGLQPGDAVTKVNRTATPDTETLAAVLAGLDPGHQVPITITRANGSATTVQLTLGQLPGT